MNSEEILKFLDGEFDRFRFPLLDNGYYYLAATRLSLFRSASDWGLGVEIFNFDPRAFRPGIHIYVFGSRLENRDAFRIYSSDADHEAYLLNNPHNGFLTFEPVTGKDWLDPEEPEFLAPSGSVCLRDEEIALPDIGTYKRYGIRISEGRPLAFEFTRYLAAIRREKVLATPEERRSLFPSDMAQIIQLEEWHHPDVGNGEVPSNSEAFRLLAKVLETKAKGVVL